MNFGYFDSALIEAVAAVEVLIEHFLIVIIIFFILVLDFFSILLIRLGSRRHYLYLIDLNICHVVLFYVLHWGWKF